MANNFQLNAAALQLIFGKVKAEMVAKVDGKGLSTNDLTDELLAKINAAGTAADLSALTERVGANETAIGVLNGNSSVEGSVDKKIADAFNTFVTETTENGKIDKFKEMVDYIATHGTEYTTLAGSVQTNTNAIATLNGDVNTAGSVAKSIADAIAAEDLSQYATVVNLTAATDRIKAIEDDYVKASEVVAMTQDDIDAAWAAAV